MPERDDLIRADADITILLDCEACDGSGTHTFDPPVGDEAANQTEPCPECGGRGFREEIVKVMELVRLTLDHVPEGNGHVPLPQLVGFTELTELARQAYETMRKASTRAAAETPMREEERQDALRTVQEAAGAIRAIAELSR